MNSSFTFQKRIMSLLSAGMKEEPSPEILEKLHLTFLINALAISMMLIFAAEAIFRGDFYNALFLFFLTALVIINIVFIIFSGNDDFFNRFSVWVITAMCVYLLSTGGVNNSGILWCYIFPLLSLYLLGIERGSMSLLILLVCSCALFYIPNNPFALVEYSSTLKIHFLASMVTVTVLSYFYEYTSRKSYDKLLSVSLELEEATLTDFLTGLGNRRKILQQIKYEKNSYERYPQQFSIILCDIDYFKKINDTHGHDCGDHVLKSVADIFTETLRNVDIVARWGGEEFLVLLPKIDRNGSIIAAERLRHNIEQMNIHYGNVVVNITMSFGISTWKETDNDVEAFINQADENLYRAKEEGRNRVVTS